jgi:alanyl-tRNA synthetase
VELRVDDTRRNRLRRHHSATHLLHEALRRTLGPHVTQKGSLVAPDRLRFDFSHPKALTADEIQRIEDEVNARIRLNSDVATRLMTPDAAMAEGAMALFGEKYGDEVRVVSMGGDGEKFSTELCGGTHVRRTGDIGAFTLVADTAIASGVRRIEALCGHEAMRWLKGQTETLHRAAVLFQARPETVPEQVEKLRGELERLRKAQGEAQRGGLAAEMTRLAESATVAPGGRWVVAALDVEADADAVRDAADRLRGALKRGAAVLAVRAGGKLTFVAAASDDLVAEKKLRADDLVRSVAKVTGGSGGGKPHLALAGGKDAAKLDAALDEARRLLGEALAG